MTNIQHRTCSRLREQHLIVSRRILVDLVFVFTNYLSRPFAIKYQRVPSVHRGRHLTGDLLTKHLVRFFSVFFLALTLLTTVGCASTKEYEGSGEYVDDSVITTKVKAAILDEPGLSSTEINVETFKGVVQLSGFVSSRADINKAVAVARGVGGVKSVKNAMRLK